MADHFLQVEMMPRGTYGSLFHKKKKFRNVILVVVDMKVGSKEASKNSIIVHDRYRNDECTRTWCIQNLDYVNPMHTYIMLQWCCRFWLWHMVLQCPSN